MCWQDVLQRHEVYGDEQSWLSLLETLCIERNYHQRLHRCTQVRMLQMRSRTAEFYLVYGYVIWSFTECKSYVDIYPNQWYPRWSLVLVCHKHRGCGLWNMGLQTCPTSGWASQGLCQSCSNMQLYIIFILSQYIYMLVGCTRPHASHFYFHMFVFNRWSCFRRCLAMKWEWLRHSTIPHLPYQTLAQFTAN